MKEKHLLSTFITILVLWIVAANPGFAEEPFSDYPEVTKLEFPSTGSWNTVGSINQVTLELNSGFNSIEFFNNNGPAPDFDKIVISADTACNISYEQEAEKNVFVGDARIIEKTNMSGGKGIGYLGRGVENYLVYNVYVKNGTGCSYEMTIDYANGDSNDRTAYMVTNKPPICPRWALEPWVWEDNINTQAAIENVVQGYLDRNIPVGAVIIDSPWETCYNNFEWWGDKYPNPQQMIDDFHSDGIKVIMWITGFVNNVTWEDIPLKKCENYDAVESLSVNGGEDFNWWKGRGRHIDFTNPNAKQWWHEQMDKVLVDMDIDGWKTDQGADYVSDPVNTSIGSIQRQIFKKYYYADLYDYSVSVNPKAISTARAYSYQGGLGAPISKSPISWQGDFGGDFDGLKEQMKDVYRSAEEGYGAPGVEVGGFHQPAPTRESLIRYSQFGAMTPLMENGGANGGIAEHLPWYWDEETIDIYRYFATLHSELVPYIFSYSVESNLTGISTLRNVDKDRSHHKLGEEIFISIMTDASLSKPVELPKTAEWIDYWREDHMHIGGITFEYNMDSLKEFPIFLKVGAIIPMNVKNDVTGHGDNSSEGKITLNIYPGGESSGLTFHRPLGDGIEYEDIVIDVDESESGGTIQINGNSPLEYILRVKSFSKPDSVSVPDEDWRYDTDNRYVIINKQGEDFIVIINPLDGYPHFADVPPGFWAEEHIYKIYEAGITKGCSQNPLMYCPKRDVTRDQMAAFLVRAVEGEPPADYCDTGSPFSDVASSSLFCKYIKRLSELGITKGCGGGKYCPKTTVKRDQMAAFLVRAVEGEPPADYCDTGSPFSDVSQAALFCKYIKRLSELGITKGCGGGNYCPKTTVKRDQMAVFLGRAFLEME